MSATLEVAFVVGHVNGWKEEVKTILSAMVEFARIPDNSPSDGMEALAAFAERFGSSCYLVRKIAYLMSRYGDDTSLQAPFQRIAKKLAQSKHPEPYFAALELMDCERSYFNVSTRVQIYEKYVDTDYREYYPLHEVLPIPISRKDLAAHLRKSHSTSLVDEIISLVAIVNLRDCWPNLYQTLNDLLDGELLSMFHELAFAPFNSKALYDGIDPLYADIVFYQRAAAFVEFNDCAAYRCFADLILAPRLMSNLKVKSDIDMDVRPVVTVNDLTKGLQGFVQPHDYQRIQSCGGFLRTIQLLSFLDKDGCRVVFS